MSSEALRLAGELPSVENLKKIAASDSPKAIQNALNNSIKWIQSLERELKFERAASFRDQIASLEAERDQLRAEVERLRKPLTDEQIDALLPTPDGSAEANVTRVEVSPGIWGAEYDEVEAWSKPLVRQLVRAIEAAKEAK